MEVVPLLSLRLKLSKSSIKLRAVEVSGNLDLVVGDRVMANDS